MLSQDNLPYISIITIVYNGSNTLEKTIQSIINQDYKNLEYIIIDGNSTDGTQQIIEKYSNKISYWISEKDKGLYDAMNKGLIRATGDYVWFINSGDLIPTETTISEIFQNREVPYADVYYGDTTMIDLNGNIIGERRLTPPKNLTANYFKQGMLVSHQSFIAKRSLTQLYDTNYRFSADFNWCLQILTNAKTIEYTNSTLSLYLDGGLTKKNILKGLRERFIIMTKQFGLLSTLANHIIIGSKFFYYVIVNKRF